MLDSETIVKTLKYYEATIENAFVKCAFRKAITLIEQQELAINNLKTELENRVKKLEKQPEIVRCKDCKRGILFDSTDDRETQYDCEFSGIHIENWFCADGERKDDG